MAEEETGGLEVEVEAEEEEVKAVELTPARRKFLLKEIARKEHKLGNLTLHANNIKAAIGATKTALVELKKELAGGG